MWLLLSYNNSVNVEMSLLLLLVLVLPLSNRVCSEQSGLKENVKDDLEETMYKMDDIENKVEELERKLETKNVNVENLQKQLKELKAQFESNVEEGVAKLRSEMLTELKTSNSRILHNVFSTPVPFSSVQFFCVKKN